MHVSLLKRVCLAMLVLCAGGAWVAQDQSPNSAPCAAPEYRQFDFWLGDWDVFEREGVTKAARVRVDRILDGCVLHESYEDPKGLRGESFTIYDRSRKVWHQSWVTNKGQLLSIEGQMRAGEMVLSGSYRAKSGEETLVRGTWKPAGDIVRETAFTSTDRGKTWKPWFDLLFRRRAAG